MAIPASHSSAIWLTTQDFNSSHERAGKKLLHDCIKVIEIYMYQQLGQVANYNIVQQMTVIKAQICNELYGLWNATHVQIIKLLQLFITNRNMFISSYRKRSGSLGEQEMLWEHKLQISVSPAFLSSLKLSQMLL